MVISRSTIRDTKVDNTVKLTTYTVSMKLCRSLPYGELSLGNLGGSSTTTCLSWSNGVPQVL